MLPQDLRHPVGLLATTVLVRGGAVSCSVGGLVVAVLLNLVLSRNFHPIGQTLYVVYSQ